MSQRNYKQERVENIKKLIDERGLTIVPRGKAFWVTGIGVDLLVASLAVINPHELKPYRGRMQ